MPYTISFSGEDKARRLPVVEAALGYRVEHNTRQGYIARPCLKLNRSDEAGKREIGNTECKPKKSLIQVSHYRALAGLELKQSPPAFAFLVLGTKRCPNITSPKGKDFREEIVNSRNCGLSLIQCIKPQDLEI